MAELEVARPLPPLTVLENGRHERVDAVPQTASTWRVPDRGAPDCERPSVALSSHLPPASRLQGVSRDGMVPARSEDRARVAAPAAG